MPVLPSYMGSVNRRISVQAALVIKQDPISKISNFARLWWLIPIIPAIQEAEIRRIAVPSHLRQIVHKTLSGKKPS
jgi:hypothetical protein